MWNHLEHKTVRHLILVHFQTSVLPYSHQRSRCCSKYRSNPAKRTSGVCKQLFRAKVVKWTTLVCMLILWNLLWLCISYWQPWMVYPSGQTTYAWNVLMNGVSRYLHCLCLPLYSIHQCHILSTVYHQGWLKQPYLGYVQIQHSCQ